MQEFSSLITESDVINSLRFSELFLVTKGNVDVDNLRQHAAKV